MKTGEVFWRDDDGQLWLCESFRDEAGVATTKATLVVPNANHEA